MNKRSVAFMKSHDIDWLFLINDKLIHCATNGAVIPEKYAVIKHLNFCKREVRARMPILTDNTIEYNEAHIDRIVRQQIEFFKRLSELNEARFIISETLIKENYISSFKQMTLRGAYSYDYIGPLAQDGKVIAQEFALVT